MFFAINRRRVAVHVLSVYLLWPMLPLVFGCIWGIDFGYDRRADFPLLFGAIEDVPSMIWWLLSPITFFATLPLSILLLIFPRATGNFVFSGVSPCLKGDWDAFPLFDAGIGWLLAYALCLFLAVKICSCQRSIEVLGKKRSLSLLLKAFCCVISLTSLFICEGRGPYDARSDDEQNVFKILGTGVVASGEEKFGYRFLSDNLAVPLKYGRGNRARTFCKVTVCTDSPHPEPSRIRPELHTFFYVKDTGGMIEPLPKVVPKGQYYGLDIMIRQGWRLH